MPDLACVFAELLCPTCGTVAQDAAVFQWGYCSGQAPWTHERKYQYVVGDRVRWATCADGSIPSWSYWSLTRGANVGNPGVRDLLLTDWWNSERPWACHRCGQLIGGTAVKILGNVITDAWCYMPGEYDEYVHTYVFSASGTLEAKPEWEDHAMSLATCDKGQLTTAP